MFDMVLLQSLKSKQTRPNVQSLRVQFPAALLRKSDMIFKKERGK